MSEENQVACDPEWAKRQRWWMHWKFPLVPWIEFKKGDDRNTKGFKFHWLFFSVWSSDTPAMQFQISIEEKLSIRLEPPYLHCGIFIPLMPWKWFYSMWRKPRMRIFDED